MKLLRPVLAAWICLLAADLSATSGYELLDLDRGLRVVYSGEISQLDRPFHPLELARLSTGELRVLRSAYYARRGFQFHSAELARWFGQFDWYDPQPAGTPRLSELDTAAIERIQGVESAKPVSTISDGPLATALLGTWHRAPHDGPSYSDLLRLYATRFAYQTNRTQPDRRVVELRGEWELEDGYLLLAVSEYDIRVGGIPESGLGANGAEMRLRGARSAEVHLRTPVVLRLAVGQARQADTSPSLERLLGGFPFWQISVNPDYP